MRTIWLLTGIALVGCAPSDDTGPLDTSDPGATAACPVGEALGDDACVLSGVYTEDVTLGPDFRWLLRGGVFIGDDENPMTLTILPGTTVYGEASTGGMLVVRRGARLVADGTVGEPIVFTSSKAEGDRARGDWGGIILNGRATINSCAGADVEGPCEAFGEGGTGYYGGGDDDDDSGVLRYVRVEFAGTLISPENELNGIAFQGVGRGTTVDFVQVHQNDDDGLEFFGGTVDVRHLLVTGVSDDLFDWTDGWRGRGQYLVGQQYPGVGDNGIEADNNAEARDATPTSAPTLSNVTLIGSPGSAASDLGLLLREGTAGKLANVLVVGFDEACVDVDHAETFGQADAGALALDASVLSCTTTFIEDDGEPSVATWFDGGLANAEGAEVPVVDPYNVAAPDFRPAGAALSGAVVPVDGFFEEVDFRGGVDPEDDWTAGWTTAVEN